MSLTRLLSAALVALAFSGAIACSDDTGGDMGGTGGSSNTVSCTDDLRLDVYTDNMAKEGELGALTFRFSDFEPAPPAKGSNTFRVQVTNPSGDVLTHGLAVSLIMPDHGHGTSIKPVVSLDAASGVYTVTPLYLFMPGVWRITFDAAAARSDAAALDRVDLHFCVEG
jgi:hypothetical protein